MGRTFERLQKKIKKQFGMELTNFHRTYVGQNALSWGGYSWEAYKIVNGCRVSIVGSCYSATELLKAKKLKYWNGQFSPDN